jgi:uncharacterized protein
MTEVAYRAWRFQHPELDPGVRPPGLGLEADGRISMVAGAESVRQALLLLISTRPGERVMRPGYGCDLHQLVFGPNDETAHGLAIHLVRQAIERWEPRIEILGLDADRDPDRPDRLLIMLDYQVRTMPEADRLVVPLQLGGEGA